MKSQDPSEKDTLLEAVMKECRPAFRSVAIFSFVINGLMLATPIYMIQVMDRVLRSGKVETLLLLTLIASGALLVMCLLDTLRSSIAVRTASWINEKLGPAYLEACCQAQLAGDAAGTERLRDLQIHPQLRFDAKHGGPVSTLRGFRSSSCSSGCCIRILA